MIYVICDEISIFYGQKTLGSSIFLSHSLRVSFCLYRRKNNKRSRRKNLMPRWCLLLKTVVLFVYDSQSKRKETSVTINESEEERRTAAPAAAATNTPITEPATYVYQETHTHSSIHFLWIATFGCLISHSIISANTRIQFLYWACVCSWARVSVYISVKKYIGHFTIFVNYHCCCCRCSFTSLFLWMKYLSLTTNN